MRRRGLVLSLAFALLAGGLPAAAAGGVKLRAQGAIYDDAAGGSLSSPEGVAFGAGSMLAVADTGHGRITTYRVTPRGVEAAGGFTPAEAPYPVRLQVTAKGEILVLDGRTRKVGRYGADGGFKGFVDPGVPGKPVVRALRLDHLDQIYLLDVAAPRVLVLDPKGALLRELPLPAAAGFFSDIAVDARGSVYALDSTGHQVFVVRPGATEAAPFGGSLAEELNFATGLAASASGHLFVLDQYGDGVVVLGPDGSFQGRHGTRGAREGFLSYPTELAYDPNGFLYVADRNNNRVQVFAVAQ